MKFPTSFNAKPSKTVQTDLYLIAATLMFAVINADDDIDQLEIAQVGDILRSRHALTSDEIRSFIDAAKKAIISDQSIEEFTAILCQNWDKKERTQLLNDFWELATADNEIKIDERLMIELIANNLDLDVYDITNARNNAEQRLEFNIG